MPMELTVTATNDRDLDRQTVASLPQPVLRSVQEVMNSDYELVGYRLTDAVPDAALAEARSILATSMRPASRDALARELVRLRAVTVSRNAGAEDQALILSAYAEALAELPGNAVIATLCDWAKQNKFWPALAEIVDGTNDRCRHRRAMMAAIRRRAPAIGKAQHEPRSIPTADEISEVEATVSRWRETLSVDEPQPRVESRYVSNTVPETVHGRKWRGTEPLSEDAAE